MRCASPPARGPTWRSSAREAGGTGPHAAPASRGREPGVWARRGAEADARAGAGEATRVTVRGTDRDPTAIRSARDNAARAGVGRLVCADTGVLADAAPLAARDPDRPGLLCTHPPYGLRMEGRA